MFTSEEAYDQHKAGDPIMISVMVAEDIIEDHGATMADFLAETDRRHIVRHQVDAWLVLAWLGY